MARKRPIPVEFTPANPEKYNGDNEVCLICNSYWKSIASLGKHINQTHKIKSQDYFDKYKKGNKICEYCSIPTKFSGLGLGYKRFCSPKCAMYILRQELRKDTEKYNSFVEKVRNNQTRIWQERENFGVKNTIFEKTSDKLKKIAASLTPEQRKQKYGWMNKLTPEHKKIVVQDILQKSLIKFYKNATREQIKNLNKKGLATKIRKGICHEKSTESFTLYSRYVRSLSDINYRKFKHIINPLNLPRSRYQYHLDHKFSISKGYSNKISPEVMASIINLEMIESSKNIAKYTKCSLLLEELLNG